MLPAIAKNYTIPKEVFGKKVENITHDQDVKDIGPDQGPS
jgi:hypothetical protein